MRTQSELQSAAWGGGELPISPCDIEILHTQKMRSEQIRTAFPRGGGGSRTRVQTRSPKAFYTFILRLILLRGMAADDLTLAAVP